MQGEVRVAQSIISGAEPGRGGESGQEETEGQGEPGGKGLRGSLGSVFGERVYSWKRRRLRSEREVGSERFPRRTVLEVITF